MLIPCTQMASILSSAVVGAFSITLSLDLFMGGSLVYLLINVVRRAVVDNFQLAVLPSPFQV